MHPAAQTNGVAERFLRTLEGNWLWVHHFATIAGLIEGLQEFQRRSNDPWLIERDGYRSPAQVRQDLTAPIPAVALNPGTELARRLEGTDTPPEKTPAPVDSGSSFPDI